MGVAARFALLGRNSEKSACRTHGGGGVASRTESALTLILTGWGMSGNPWSTTGMINFRRGKVVRATWARNWTRKSPGDLGEGRRLVIWAKPRISCSIFIILILVAIRSTRSFVRSSCARTSKPCRFTAAASEIDLDDGMEPCGMDRTQIPASHLDWQRPPSLKPGENYFR